MRFFSVTAAFHFVPRFEFIESNTDLLTPRLADPVGAVLLAIVALLLRTGLFINPPAPGLEGDYTGNPQYEIGSTITLEWSTSWSNIELDLLQENTKENARSLLDNYPNPGKYVYTVSDSGFDLRSRGEIVAPVFYFRIVNTDIDSPRFTLHYFNMTSKASASSSAAATATTSFPSQATTSANRPSSTSQVTASTSQRTASTSQVTAHPNNPSPAPDVTIALGVGLGLGIPLALATGAALTWVLLRRRGKAAAGRSSVPAPPNYFPAQGHDGDKDCAAATAVYPPAGELDGQRAGEIAGVEVLRELPDRR